MPVNDELARKNYERYSYCRDNGHLDYLDRDKRCNLFFEGIQWEEKVRRQLERYKRPVKTINKVFVAVVNLMGEQLMNRLDATVRPAKDGAEESAQSLSKVLMQILNSQNYDRIESEMFDDGIIGSRGFIDMRLSFDDQLRGEARLRLLNPRNVLLEPGASLYDPDEWPDVIISKWMLADDIAYTYNKADAKILAQRTKSGFAMGYDAIDDMHQSFGNFTEQRLSEGDIPDDRRRIRVIERQYREMSKALHFLNPETGDIRVVPPSWDEERVARVRSLYGWELFEKETRLIRSLVTADNVVLHNGLHPLKHYTPIPFFPILRRGKTIGWVENMIDPQELLNKTESQELHVINSTANGGWQMEDGQLVNLSSEELEQRGAETGLVLVRAPGTPPLDKIQPNQIPTGLDRKSYKMDEYLKDLSGVSDSDRGFDREDVAAKAIKEKKAAGSRSKAKMFENLARTREIVVRNLLDLVQEYYTEERVMMIEGRTPSQPPEELVINQVQPDGSVVNDLTAGEYNVVVTQVPARDSFFETQLDEALKIQEAGVQLPPTVFIENSNLAKKREIIEAMSNSGQQEYEQQMAQLELQERQQALVERQFEMERKKAEAKLADARAQKTLVDAQVTAQGTQEQGTEMFQHQLERERMEREFQFKYDQMDREFALKREEMQREDVRKRAEANLRLKAQQQASRQQATRR